MSVWRLPRRAGAPVGQCSADSITYDNTGGEPALRYEHAGQTVQL